MARMYRKRNLAKARRAKKRKRLTYKSAAAKRTTVYQVGKKKGITADIGIEGIKTTININRPISGGYQHEKAISPHYEANLLFPDRPFSVRTELIRKIQGGYISTAIHSFEYIPDTKTLKVTFWKIRIRKGKIVSRRAGSTYLFFNVSNRRYLNFLKASSKGRYFYYNIRGWFKYKRIS